MRGSLFLLALLLAGCGGDGAGPSTLVQHVPEISSLKLSQSHAEYMAGDGQLMLVAGLSFEDAGQDVVELCIEMPDGTRVEFEKASSATKGELSQQIAVSTKSIGTYTVEVWVEDKAGDSSNHLSTKFDVVSNVHTSDWTSRLSGVLPLNDVLWNGERFVAVGDGGTILTSHDGIDWVQRQSGTDAELVAVASNDAFMVAVGYDATVLRSTDGGLSWVVRHSGEPIRLAAAAIGPEQIVVGGMHLQTGDAFMMRSVTGGETWAAVGSLPQSGHFVTDLVYANDIFVAATDAFSPESDARVMVSSNGDVWNEIVLRDEMAASYAILHDGQQFIAAGSQQTVFTSPDGYNWTELPTPVDRVTYLSAAWSGARLVVAGGTTQSYWANGMPAFERPVGLLSANGGVTWGLFNVDGYYQSNGMAWGNDRFVSVGQLTPVSGVGAIYTSD